MWLHIGIFAIGIVYVVGDCGVPPDIPYASHDWTGSTPIPDDTTVTYVCSTLGYEPKLGADATYTCSLGTWSGGNFECKIITCGHIEPPMHGYVANDVTYVVGSKMKFACNEGYTVSGTSTLTCRTDGYWLPNTAPSCNIVTCPEWQDIPNANTQLISSINGVRTEYSSIVKVTCNNDFVVKGFPTVQCQASGQWTVSPTCAPITCSPYPGLNSSCIHQVAWEPAILLLYLICNTEHTSPVGPIDDGVACYASGWEDVSMACFCDCHVAADLTLVTLSNVNAGYIKHGKELIWSCKNGGTKITGGSLVCYNGNITVPECQPSTTVPTTQKPTSFSDCHVAADLTLVTLSNVDASGYIKHGKELIWSCKNGGTKITGGSLVCYDGNITVPECQPSTTVPTTQKPTSFSDCRVAADLTLVTLSNVDANGYIKHGKELIWSCKNGATKITGGSLVCYDGNIAVPECQPSTTVPTTPVPTTQKPTTTGELPEDPFNVLVIVFIIIGAVVLAIGVAIGLKRKELAQCMRKAFNSNDNAGTDVELKSGKDTGNGAGVTVASEEKKVEAAGAGAPMLQT